MNGLHNNYCARKTLVTERIFELDPIFASLISQILWIKLSAYDFDYFCAHQNIYAHIVYIMHIKYLCTAAYNHENYPCNLVSPSWFLTTQNVNVVVATRELFLTAMTSTICRKNSCSFAHWYCSSHMYLNCHTSLKLVCTFLTQTYVNWSGVTDCHIWLFIKLWWKCYPIKYLTCMRSRQIPPRKVPEWFLS